MTSPGLPSPLNLKHTVGPAGKSPASRMRSDAYEFPLRDHPKDLDPIPPDSDILRWLCRLSFPSTTDEGPRSRMGYQNTTSSHARIIPSSGTNHCQRIERQLEKARGTDTPPTPLLPTFASFALSSTRYFDDHFPSCTVIPPNKSIKTLVPL